MTSTAVQHIVFILHGETAARYEIMLQNPSKNTSGVTCSTTSGFNFIHNGCTENVLTKNV